MRVFVSHSSEDAELIRSLQQALERRNIEASSTLDVPPGELRSERIEQAGANADAFIFLLGAGGSANPQLQTERRALLRSDWDGKKPMIPVLLHGQQPSDLPKFLANRNALFTTNFDLIADQVERVIQNPSEGRNPKASEQARAELSRRLEDVKDFAEALRKERTTDTGAITRR
jgi:hypothetical protein